MRTGAVYAPESAARQALPQSLDIKIPREGPVGKLMLPIIVVDLIFIHDTNEHSKVDMAIYSKHIFARSETIADNEKTIPAHRKYMLTNQRSLRQNDASPLIRRTRFMGMM